MTILHEDVSEYLLGVGNYLYNTRCIMRVVLESSDFNSQFAWKLLLNIMAMNHMTRDFELNNFRMELRWTDRTFLNTRNNQFVSLEYRGIPHVPGTMCFLVWAFN